MFCLHYKRIRIAIAQYTNVHRQKEWFELLLCVHYRSRLITIATIHLKRILIWIGVEVTIHFGMRNFGRQWCEASNMWTKQKSSSYQFSCTQDFVQKSEKFVWDILKCSCPPFSRFISIWCYLTRFFAYEIKQHVAIAQCSCWNLPFKAIGMLTPHHLCRWRQTSSTFQHLHTLDASIFNPTHRFEPFQASRNKRK